MNERILLIDDDPTVHDIIRMILEPEGYRIIGCATGQEGLSALKTERPDLLLLDIMLATPDEGLRLAQAIRDEAALDGIPLVLISSIGERHGVDLSQELGSRELPADAFLEKPLDPRKLKETVAVLLKRDP